MHLQPIFSSCDFYGSDNAEFLFKYGLCLTSGSNMKNEDLNRIVTKIKEAFEN